jgi:hypothetical protein
MAPKWNELSAAARKCARPDVPSAVTQALFLAPQTGRDHAVQPAAGGPLPLLLLPRLHDSGALPCAAPLRPVTAAPPRRATTPWWPSPPGPKPSSWTSTRSSAAAVTRLVASRPPARSLARSQDLAAVEDELQRYLAPERLTCAPPALRGGEGRSLTRLRARVVVQVRLRQPIRSAGRHHRPQRRAHAGRALLAPGVPAPPSAVLCCVLSACWPGPQGVQQIHRNTYALQQFIHNRLLHRMSNVRRQAGAAAARVSSRLASRTGRPFRSRARAL